MAHSPVYTETPETGRHVESFLDMLAAERGVSDNTRHAYRRDLGSFAKFLTTRDCVIDGADTTLIRDYMASLARARFAPSTGARRLSALRQFHRYLLAEGFRDDDPSAAVDGPRRGRPLPKVLSEAEVDALLQAARRDRGPRGARLVALVELLYATGLRVSELVGLPLAAISRDRTLVMVRGKGGRERIVPLGEPAVAAIGAYLPHRRVFAAAGGESPWMFPSRGADGHLGRSRVSVMLKELAARAGLDPAAVTPSCLLPPENASRGSVAQGQLQGLRQRKGERCARIQGEHLDRLCEADERRVAWQWQGKLGESRDVRLQVEQRIDAHRDVREQADRLQVHGAAERQRNGVGLTRGRDIPLGLGAGRSIRDLEAERRVAEHRKGAADRAESEHSVASGAP